MSKSTATVTWISHRNFGTILQAYALQQTLLSLGYENKIIDDSKVVSSFRKKRFSPLRLLRSISWLYPERALFNRLNASVLASYEDFRRRYLDIDSQWETRDDLSERYDVFIAGSDQIWSPNVPFDDFYYLAFTERPKVAYGPSLGVSVYPEDMVPVVAPLLRRFSSLSVRESVGADILRSRFSLEPEVVADPTILLKVEAWEKLMAESEYYSQKDDPYALCYFLTYNNEYIDKARDYCRRNSLKMKIVVASHEFAGLNEDKIYTGPVGFLDYIRRADVVLTDSFHGTIFSLLFRKTFFAFRRFDASSPSNQNSRVENLLSCLGQTARLVDSKSCLQDHTSIEWDKVESGLDGLRRRSLKFINDSLAGL